MSYKTANYLIIILAVATMILLVTLAAVWLRSPSLTPAQAVLPTQEVIAVLPAPDLPLDQIDTPTALPVAPDPTETPVIRPAQATVTPLPTRASITHVVQPGETLINIATQYNVSVADIVDLNQLSNPDAIDAGQTLLIPVNPGVQPAETATVPSANNPAATAVIISPTPTGWPPSQTGVDVRDNYPLTTQTASGSVIIYYQPDTYPQREIVALTQSIDDIWIDIQAQLGRPFPRSVDLHLAGTLFSVNPALQGLSQSAFTVPSCWSTALLIRGKSGTSLPTS
jgi:LysM repeat protein